jgi:universal stress protein A
MKTEITTSTASGLVQESNHNAAMVHGESWFTPHRNLDLRRIIVPLDFSQCSRKALQYAAASALEFGAELWLVHVVQPFPLLPDAPGAGAEMDAARIHSAAQNLEEWAKTIGPIRATCAVRVGEAAEEITKFARNNHADLIIMATSGRTGFARLVVGSVAEKVLRSAPCPLFVVRDAEKDFLKPEPDDPILNRAGLVRESGV